MSNVIEMQDVQRHFDSGMIRALDGVTLAIQAGEHTAVLGPSGSGKTTLLNLMGAIDYPTSGTVRIRDQEITPTAKLCKLRSEYIGFIFQLHNLIPQLTLLENVMLPLYPRRLAPKERKERAEAVLVDVALQDRMHFLPVRASGGERQRAAIARALVNEPQLILADEPTGNLDQKNAARLCELLHEIASKEQRTLVMVTHSDVYAREFSRVISLCDGKIVSDSGMQ